VIERKGLAGIWHGTSDLRMEPQVVGEAQPGRAIVRMLASGVCGSDVHAVHGDFNLWKPPVILGHEGVGIVEELGEGVAPASVGQLVAVCPSVSCGVCYHCREGEELLCSHRSAHLGAFADYADVPLAALYPLPDGVSWRAGIFTEPLSAALHAITLADVKPGEWVGVVGGGAVGMLLLQLAHQKGANVLLSEPGEERRRIALRLGAEVVVDPRSDDVVKAALDATGGVGLDRVVEAVGRPATVQQAMQMARRGGTVVVMGVADRSAEIPIRPYDLYERQLTLRGSFIRNFDFQRAVRLLGRLELESLVTAEFALDRLPEAIETVAAGKGLKTVVVTSGLAEHREARGGPASPPPS
jgi:L-iditol 2-dehydrogenase